MWFQWPEQMEYINMTWHCGAILAHLFVFVNMICQIGGCGLVLLRKFVPVAVGMLFGIIILQVWTVWVHWDAGASQGWLLGGL